MGSQRWNVFSTNDTDGRVALLSMVLPFEFDLLCWESTVPHHIESNTSRPAPTAYSQPAPGGQATITKHKLSNAPLSVKAFFMDFVCIKAWSQNFKPRRHRHYAAPFPYEYEIVSSAAFEISTHDATGGTLHLSCTRVEPRGDRFCKLNQSKTPREAQHAPVRSIQTH